MRTRLKQNKNLETTFCCTVEVYTIADSTSKNGGIEERQHISSSELFKTPIDNRIIIKNAEYDKRETTNNHVLQQNNVD